MNLRCSIPHEEVKIVLEVGGGASCALPIPGAEYTVIDLDEDALARNAWAGDKILADAQGFDYGKRRFDAVVFWNVLEHIPRPDLALSAALRHLRPGGYVLIAGPTLNSLKAMVTRWTPYPFHVWFYRKVLRKPHAGQQGHSPFRVEHTASADPGELVRQLQDCGCEVLQLDTKVGSQVRILQRHSPTLYKAYAGAAFLLARLSGGRIPEETDFVLLGRKSFGFA